MIMFRPLIRYADFKGRASRAEYWLFGLLQGVWYTLLLGLAVVAMGQSETGKATAGVLVAFGLIAVSVIALIVPNYAVLVRRLHDSGRGAIWLGLMMPSIASGVLILATLGTAVGSVGLGASREAFLATMLAGLGTAGLMGSIGMVCQIVMLVLTLLPGTRGENRFGPDPRDPSRHYRAGDGGTTYDEARLEALFAEAKRANGVRDDSYRPAFDFGGGPTPSATSHTPLSAQWGAPTAGAGPRTTFGKRGT